jgi:hypothetical protein
MNIYHIGLLNIIPDRFFVQFIYRMSTGKKLNLENPTTFNEKIQWIKLYDHNSLYTVIADKYMVRKYVQDKVGGQYLIPLVGRWEKVEDIDFDVLPKQFVLKCNHDSGGIVICPDKDRLDIKDAKDKLNSHLKYNYFYLNREWAYKNIKPCVIAEKYLIDDETQELRDYKFFCFNGIPKFIQVDFNRFVEHKRNLYSLDWKLLDLTIKCPNDPCAELKKPENLNEMIDVARKLSVGFPEVRVDLYSVNGKTYFGELTLYHGGGIEKFSSDKFAEEMGSWVELSLAYKE